MSDLTVIVDDVDKNTSMTDIAPTQRRSTSDFACTYKLDGPSPNQTLVMSQT